MSTQFTIKINDIPITVELATDPASRETGLMDRSELAENTGMLFAFPDSQQRSFWMKNTYIPLSIAYIEEGGQIIDIEDMLPHDLQGIQSSLPATYALEMNQGWFDNNDIMCGDQVTGIKEIQCESLVRGYVKEKLLTESVILTEAANSPGDLPAGVFVKIEPDPHGVTIFYATENGRPTKTGSGVEGEILLETLDPGESLGPCGGAWMIGSAQATGGWGPLLYDVAMEYATMNGGGLISDRGSVSGPARKVWDYYMNNRGDVTGIQMDDLKNTLTPEEEDNCSQRVATATSVPAFGSEKSVKTDWVKSPLSKRWTKPPTTIEALRAAGKLIFEEWVESRKSAPAANESFMQKYTRQLLVEKKLRGQKDKRVLYHINLHHPAKPQPKMTYMQDWDPDVLDREGDKGDYVNVPGTDNWQRHWLKSTVKSGVFLTPNPLDIAMNHGRSGHVYAYKVPEWVIDKSGGMHRYDTGSEVLIPEDVWNEAGKEIEFLGKSMEKEELWEKMMGSMYGRGHNRPAKKPSWMSDEELKQWQAGQDKFNLPGLRATKHPEDVIKLLKPEERRKAVEAIMAKTEDQPGFIEKGPRDKKGIVVPPFGRRLDKKDQELLALLQKHIKESKSRIRKIIIENLPPWMIDAIQKREEREERKKEIGRRLPLRKPLSPPPKEKEKEYRDPEDDPAVVDYSLQKELRSYIAALFEANEYGWKISSKKNMMLDQEGMEQRDKDNQEKFLKSMNMMEVQEYIRELLKEDPMGFVHDLAAASEDFGENFFGGDPGKGGGKAIKRAFNANADHQFLSTLDTVHWVEDPYSLEYLVGKSKDELSTTMNLSGDKLKNPPGMLIGLWVKGRITLASNDHDQLFTGKWHDYVGAYAGYTDEEQEQRQKSSGINKLPHVSKDYSRYGQLKRGNEFAEKTARSIPYVLDQSTWDPYDVNEALVDNWKPIGIIAGKWLEPIKLSVQSLGDEKFKANAGVNAPGVIGKIFQLAEELGVPILDRDRNELWSPE